MHSSLLRVVGLGDAGSFAVPWRCRQCGQGVAEDRPGIARHEGVSASPRRRKRRVCPAMREIAGQCRPRVPEARSLPEASEDCASLGWHSPQEEAMKGCRNDARLRRRLTFFSRLCSRLRRCARRHRRARRVVRHLYLFAPEVRRPRLPIGGQLALAPRGGKLGSLGVRCALRRPDAAMFSSESRPTPVRVE